MQPISNNSPRIPELELDNINLQTARTENLRDAHIAIDMPPVEGLSLQHRGSNPLQRKYQHDRAHALNTLHHDVVMQTSHRPISDESMATVLEINKLLLTLDVNSRSDKAMEYVDHIFEALKVDPSAAAKELVREALALQAAGAVNNAIGILPTLYGGLGPKSNAALVSFGWSLLAQVYQPYLSVHVFNAAFYGFDFARDAGIPGRSRNLEGAKTLAATSTEMTATNKKLKEALAAVESAPSQETKNKLEQALDASEAAMEARYRREIHDDSFDHGRWAQSTLSALKQILLNLTQYISFAQNKDCKGSQYAFYVQMGTAAMVQLLQLAAAPTDRMREGRLIMAANISSGLVQTKDEVRDMFRARYVQQMWLIGDGITTRCDAVLEKIAKQFDTTAKLIKTFDEAGGFNLAKFSPPMSPEVRERWNEFKSSCEGPALANCDGALEELGKLMVLEELNKLLTLEAPANDEEPTPEAVRNLASLQAKYETDTPFELLRDALGLDSLAAAKALRQGPLPPALAGQLEQLQKKYETRELLEVDDFVDVKREQVLEWAEMARAEAAVLTPLELAVRTRLEDKARGSTLNIDGWKTAPAAQNIEEAQEYQARRDKSLTPYEHALLQTLRVRPHIDASASDADRIVTNHDLAAGKLLKEPKSMAQVQDLLKKLRHHQLDRILLPFDYTRLTYETTQAIANVFLGEKNWLGNTKDAITTRWNMPGYIVPALVVQIARATFMGVGGTGFFFLLQAGAGMARRSRPETFTCTPGEGPNDHSRTFSYVMMGLSALPLGFAVLAAWGGPQAVNTARVRREFFTRREGRPSFIEMFREHYLYSARRAVTDYAGERIFTGPGIKKQAAKLIREAHAQLDRLAQQEALGDSERIAEVTDEPQDRQDQTNAQARPHNDKVLDIT
ncbi:hypothetical protein [Herbaspirillum chlorophenolicum]|uniref:hypothetical protein n=1 Tax=Herbaspirillum chlorophenolicum TaxID=211589 RepID=UPI000AFACF6F|nr:hypothetical protein [Herbaspirillum chlorophenolicum]